MPLSDELSPHIRPGDDFYAYVNQTWIKSHPIPDNKARIGAFTLLGDDNTEVLRELLEAPGPNPDSDHSLSLARTFYHAAMDEEAIEEHGLSALGEVLKAAALVKSSADIEDIITSQHAAGRSLLWHPEIEPDDRDSSRYILRLHQEGLGLPDRDNYFDEDEQSSILRTKYQELLRDLLLLLDEPQAESLAGEVFALETELAKVSHTGTQNRDPVATYNLIERNELSSHFPGFDWTAYLAALQLPELSSLVVSQPIFLKHAIETISHVPSTTWSAYLRLHLVIPLLAVLPAVYAERGFDFYGRVVSGAKEREPRARRSVKLTIQMLPEASGKLFIAKRFDAAAKERISTLVTAIKDAMRERLLAVDWLGDETKQAALAKLDSFLPLLGYPDKWRSYAELKLSNHHAANYLAILAEDWRYRSGRMHEPVDRHEWVTSPAVVNAFYWPTTNSITFPAAILQPPFFDAAGDMASNFGAIGVVIGHEITHGFDDEGSQFDGQGNLKSWWSPADRAAFESRAEKLKAQFDGYKINGKRVNGALTLGENVADLGGVLVALDAMHRYAAHESLSPSIDGFTPDQRFFIGYGRVWRSNMRPELTHMYLVSDPHAPEELRINGVVTNVDAFYEAFDVQPGQQLYQEPNKRVRIW